MNVSVDGRIDRTVMKYVDPALAARPERRLQRGDVLFNNTNSPELVGKTALFEDDDQPAFSNHMTRLRVDAERLDPDYLALRLHFAWMRGYFAEHCNNHVSQASIGREVLRSFPIELPPLTVQRAIAALVQSLHGKRSSASTHLVAAQRAIAIFRQAVLTAACSGRLTADWRERYPELVAGIAEGSRQRAVEPLIETPEEWSWTQLVDIADLKGGVQKGARLRPGEPTREVPYLRVANVQRGWLDLSEIKTLVVPESKIAELQLKPGDVLFNEGGDRDKLGRGWVWEGHIEECIHQNHVFRARLRNPKMQPRFYSWYGNTIGASYFVDQGKQTVNLASLSMSTLKALPVPVPSLDEQSEIVRRVDELLKLTEGLHGRIEAAVSRVNFSSQAVLAKAFRGELGGLPYEPK